MALAGNGMAGFFRAARPASNQHPAAAGTVWNGVAATLQAMTEQTLIERCTATDQPGWLELRLALWPDATADEHRAYMALCLQQPERFLQLVVYDSRRQPVGLIEGSIRSDYVNGTESSPVGFVEGVYVVPAWRRQGIARRLFAAIGDWARARGCRELASDALIDNEASQRAHRALGFRETERVVYFAKALTAP
jgi:aminoglycoside 6'-N-acetyltransferase I